MAKQRVKATRINHVISFDGVSYSVHVAPRYVGVITEIVKFESDAAKPVQEKKSKRTRKAV